MRLYRTSVKEDVNVGGVFQNLAENYVAKVNSYNDAYNDLDTGIGGNGSNGPLVTSVNNFSMIQIGSRDDI
jgi:hypothetical protein